MTVMLSELSMYYSFSFILALLGLSLWSLAPNNRGASFVGSSSLIVGLISWAVILAISEIEVVDKLLIGARDLLVIGIAGALFSWTKSNPILRVGLAVGMCFFLFSTYLEVLNTTLNKEQGSSLDPDGELIAFGRGEIVGHLERLLSEYAVTVSRPFAPFDKEHTLLDDLVLINIPDQHLSQLQDVKRVLENSALVEWWEENEMVQVSPIIGSEPSGAGISLTNDPYLDKLWAFNTCRVPQLYANLRSPPILPQKKVLIAILDTGIDGNHEDLKDNYLSIDEKSDRDVRGHGTHCAGVAAAVSNNGIGIASFAPNSSFLEVTGIKVLSDFGFGSQADIIKGMIKAADNGADVISMSLGGATNDERERTYTEAVKYCREKGAIVVVAAGNANQPATRFSPANTPGVITVSSINSNLGKSAFSNTVKDVEYGIAAPGENIYSTFPRNSYKALSGTSMATPYVAGLVALMKSIDPDLDVSTIHAILEATGIDSKNTKSTGKVIQPAAAIRALLD
ncbi:MAG: S8 family serine peptidase [Saprospiraceae bacterium]|nr:S8 family serine peptidase [Saprospiraceae bacterium]